MLSNLLKKLFSTAQVRKDENSNHRKLKSDRDNDVIEVGGIAVSPIFENNDEQSLGEENDNFDAFQTRRPVNVLFKSSYKLTDLTRTQTFYLKSLNLTYSRLFENIEFLELATLRLYLDLCELTDGYLAKKYQSSLKARVSGMDYGYYSYNNTFYSLYFIAETSVESHYYGRSYKDPEFSMSLLHEQIDSEIVNLIRQYLKVTVNKLPNLPSDIAEKLFSDLNSYQTLGLAFKRLDLNETEKLYLEIIPFSKNNFNEIDQCLDETIKLYLLSIEFIRELTQTHSKVSLLKLFGSLPQKNSQGYFDQTAYEKPIARTLKLVFLLCQNKIKSSYRYSRIDDLSGNSYLVRKFGKDIYYELERFIDSYDVEKPVEDTLIKLNETSRTRWKKDLELILNQGLSLSDLKDQCDRLIHLNKKNKSQYLIYFELCKTFSKKSKLVSLWYYYKYYQSVSLQDSKKSQSVSKALPKSVFKHIFETNEEKFNMFLEICEEGVSLKKSDQNTKEEISNLFKAPRRKISLNSHETQKAHETHVQVTERLNDILQEDESLDQKSATDDHEAVSVLNVEEPSTIQDFFDEDLDLNSEAPHMELSEVENELLSLFKANQFELTDLQLSEFAKSQKSFKNSLIKKINQKFYTLHEDNIIYQEEEKYLIPDHYHSLI